MRSRVSLTPYWMLIVGFLISCITMLRRILFWAIVYSRESNFFSTICWLSSSPMKEIKDVTRLRTLAPLLHISALWDEAFSSNYSRSLLCMKSEEPEFLEDTLFIIWNSAYWPMALLLADLHWFFFPYSNFGLAAPSSNWLKNCFSERSSELSCEFSSDSKFKA